MKPLTVFIEPDDTPENPSDWDGWKPFSFSSRHSNYLAPPKLGLGYDLGDDSLPKVLNPGLRRKLQVGLAFWLSYYEHGACVWTLLDQQPKCRFDSTRIAGLLIWDQKPRDMGAKTCETRAKDAAAFLDTYSNWCNGWVYGFHVDDPEGKVEGAGSFGFYDLDDMFREIKEAVGDREVVFAGQAAHMAPYHWPPKEAAR